MSHQEKHPLDPGEGSRIFIAAGVLKHPGQLTPFFDITDPEAAPTITLGSEIFNGWGGNAAKNGGLDFCYDAELGIAGNCRGLPGEGIEGLRGFHEPVRRLRDLGFKVIFSISNLPSERPIDVIPELAEKVVEIVRPTAIEVNLSCPNGMLDDGSFHPPVCNNAKASGELMQATRSRVGADQCLGIKDSAHVPTLRYNANVIEIMHLVRDTSPYIDFATGINTIAEQPFPELTAGGGRGGMSGPIIADVARDWLENWRYYAPSRIAILSCGGVDSNNVAEELPLRVSKGALLVGGAQEFYRSGKPHELAARWAIEAA